MEPKQQIDGSKVLAVRVFEAKPNPLFSEAQTQSVRFLRFSHAVPCAECGRRSKHHWTSLWSFKAMDASGRSFTLQSATDKVHAPLTPVCSKHPMALAEMPDLPPPRAKRKPR